jgi:hypothetical protein
MKYNFTDNQKELLRWIYQKVTEGEIQETFYLIWQKEKKLEHQERHWNY